MIFPPVVEYILKETLDILSEEGYFKTECSDPAKAKDIAYNILGTNLLEKFLGGEELVFGEQEIFKLLNNISNEAALHHLMVNGLIDGVEDENGEMVFWATQKGKNTLIKK